MNKIDESQIQAIAAVINEKFHPEKVILFGSYAYGTPTEDSDVDLFIIMKTGISILKQASLIRGELPSNIPIDVIVRTPEQVEERKEGDFFIKQILKEGVYL